MATSDWAIPTGKAITGATYIKDTDDNISATIEDLVDWCNNANGTYNDYTLTGLRTDFLTKTSTQTITAVTTVDTLGAIDFTGGELRIGGVAVTSTATELNILDGVTSTTSELNILDGVTATATDLNKTSNIIDGTITSGTYTPTGAILSNITSLSAISAMYSRVGGIVTVSGTVTVAPSSTSSNIFTLSLPFASAFTASSDAAGAFTTPKSTQESGTVRAYPTTNTLYFAVVPTATTPLTYTFTAQYQIK